MENDFHLSEIAANNFELGLFKYSLVPEEKFISANSNLIRMLSYPSKWEFLKENFSDLFFNQKDKTVFFEILKRNGNVKLFEVLFKKNNGQGIWVALAASTVFTKNGQKCLEGIIQDISYKKEVYQKLSTEKEFLQALFDNIPDAVYFKDKQNRIVKVNKFYTSGTGLKEEDILGKTDFDFFPYGQALEMAKDDNHVLNTGKPIIGKIEKTLLPNGTMNQVITTKIPLHNRAGEAIGTMGTTRDMTSYANFEKQRLTMVINALEVLGRALEMRDPYTFSHTRHVASISEMIAQALGWNDDRILSLKLAGELHDLGKISIPLDILNKPGKLSTLEYRFIQEHSRNCYDLIKNIDFPFPLADIIYQHHERLDGSGYPRQLSGSYILPEARILAVSDVLEAMTHHRPYREALGIEKACEELRRDKGTKYDDEVVDTLFDLVESNNNKEFWLGN